MLTNEVENTIDFSLSANPSIINKNDFIVYPNPVTSRINIQSNSTIDCIELLDVNGKEITHFQKNELKQDNSIDVSRLRAGIYFARIISGNKSSEIKFVKVGRN